MKATCETTRARHTAKRICLGVTLTLVATLSHPVATAAVTVNLGAASSFAVLAGATITNTGMTTIHGDVGLDPGSSITGGPLVLGGTTHVNDATAISAQAALAAAYADAAGRIDYASTYASGYDLSVSGTLTPGVYHGDGSLAISGGLILDALGDSAAVWIFQAPASTLTAASGSKITLLNGAQASNVFWQVGSSATLGTNSNFVGSILANTSITLNTGASVDGRVLARNGAVIMDSNIITVPEPGTTLLLGVGMAGLIAVRRRRV